MEAGQVGKARVMAAQMAAVGRATATLEAAAMAVAGNGAVERLVTTVAVAAAMVLFVEAVMAVMAKEEAI